MNSLLLHRLRLSKRSSFSPRNIRCYSTPSPEIRSSFYQAFDVFIYAVAMGSAASLGIAGFVIAFDVSIEVAAGCKEIVRKKFQESERFDKERKV